MAELEILWKWYAFKDLPPEELYDIMQLRQQVFVVEQNCAYLDCDGLDKSCLHLTGWENTAMGKKLLAYLRVLPPRTEKSLPAIGRLLTHPSQRGSGLGRLIMQISLNKINKLYRGKAVRISAQHYLLDFYSSFGFQPSSEIYSEDGIPHIEMILSSSQSLPPAS